MNATDPADRQDLIEVLHAGAALDLCDDHRPDRAGQDPRQRSVDAARPDPTPPRRCPVERAVGAALFALTHASHAANNAFRSLPSSEVS